MAQLNSACFTGGGLPVVYSPFSGAGGKIDLRLILLPNGHGRFLFGAQPSSGSGDSLGAGSVSACHAKGFFFNARKDVQRPFVKRLGGPLISVIQHFSASVGRSSLNATNHVRDAECRVKNTEILSNRELSK